MKNNILAITYWSYSEALIQTYTLPYLRIIRKLLNADSRIYLVTLEKDALKLSQEQHAEVKEMLRREGIVWLPFRYRPFGFFAFLAWTSVIARLSFVILRNRIKVIHAWCTPAGAIGYFLSVCLNCKLIIDSYEPHAESMVENGTWKNDSLPFRILFWLEKKQTHRAHAVISATEGMREYAKEKFGMVPANFLVKPACVDLKLFSRDNVKNQALSSELSLSGKIVCTYAGKLGGIYLENETFEFFKVAHDYWKDRFRIMLLSSHSEVEIQNYCKRAGLDPAIVNLKFVPHDQVRAYMGLADFAITPVKPVPTKKYCTPIKDGEYWALGLPVVIPAHISDDADIIEKYNAGSVLTKLDADNYRKAVERIDTLLKEDRDVMYTRINGLAIKYRSYGIADRVYENVYRDSF